MNLEGMPGRVFLDTCVVNFMLDYGEQIHDGAPVSVDAGDRMVRDIEALRNIMLVGQRAMWQLAVSPHTYQEIAATKAVGRRHRLHTWFNDLWRYWLEIIRDDDHFPSFVEAEDTRVQLLASGSLDLLPDLADRVLVCDAAVYRCDLFCTRDWTTILKHRADLRTLPFDIVTPAEWWAAIRPYSALWA